MAANLDILESDVKHGNDVHHREGANRWMARWLLGKDQRIIEPKIELLSEEEFRCLLDGKVMSLPGARSVYDLDYENELACHHSPASHPRSTDQHGPRRVGALRPARSGGDVGR